MSCEDVVEEFAIGTTVRLSTVLTMSGVLVDAATVTLRLTDPTGTKTSKTLAGATVTRDSTGTYHSDVVVPTAGQWKYRWESTVPVSASMDETFIVRKTKAA